MLLVIDIGNTHTVCGVFDGPELKSSWRISSTPLRTEDEILAQLKTLLLDSGIKPTGISAVAISSVVPDLTTVFSSMVHKYFGQTPLLIDARLDLGIRIHYHDPLSVGADRLCNAVAGFAKYGGPLIVVDVGAATTFDIIAPGPETAAADLHRRAAKLPRIDLNIPDHVIGQDTVSSMQIGILYGTIDGLEGMIRRLQGEIKKREGREATVVATGGFSTFLSAHTAVLQFCEPMLVLEGIRLIHERVRTTSTHR